MKPLRLKPGREKSLHRHHPRIFSGLSLPPPMPPRTGVLAGTKPPAWIEIHEADLRYRVDVRHGHKDINRFVFTLLALALIC